jgi:hypothetical protein
MGNLNAHLAIMEAENAQKRREMDERYEAQALKLDVARLCAEMIQIRQRVERLEMKGATNEPNID